MLDLATVEASLAVAAASLSLSKGSIFKPVHNWAHKRSRLLHALLTCPFCLAHWFAALAALFLEQSSWIGYVFNVGAIIMLASLADGLALKLFIWDQLEIDDLRDENDRLSGKVDDLLLLLEQHRSSANDQQTQA